MSKSEFKPIYPQVVLKNNNNKLSNQTFLDTGYDQIHSKDSSDI